MKRANFFLECAFFEQGNQERVLLINNLAKSIGRVHHASSKSPGSGKYS